ncbi:MAG: peptidylprolyl isomerase [Pseudomonas sp.]|nr:peptidylprolyl isomerase [Pseudomonas sp.]
MTNINGREVMRKIVSLSCASFFLVIACAEAGILISEDATQVTDDEFANAIEYIVPAPLQENMRSKEKNMRGFLADYFTVKVMADAARAKGLDKSPGVQVQQAYSNNRLLTEALVDDYYASAKEPNYEALAKEAYLTDPKRFDVPEQVRAEHILINVSDKQDDATALKKAKELYTEATKGKKVFADLAKEHSDDPSVVDNSGDLGFFVREAMVEPFANAAFAMKKGEISQPIKTSFGYHIIHLLDKRKAGVQPFDAVKAPLIDEQKRVFKDAKRDEIVSKFRSSSEIKVDEEAMKDFVKKMQQK